MYEWVNQHKFSLSQFAIDYPSESTVGDYLELARNITNGTKHFGSNATTRTQTGFSSDFSDDFARPLLVTLGNGTEISIDQFLSTLITFWKDRGTNGAF